MPSDSEVELEVAAEPLQCVRSDAHDTGALYVHTILPHNHSLTPHGSVSPLDTNITFFFLIGNDQMTLSAVGYQR